MPSTRRHYVDRLGCGYCSAVSGDVTAAKPSGTAYNKQWRRSSAYERWILRRTSRNCDCHRLLFMRNTNIGTVHSFSIVDAIAYTPAYQTAIDFIFEFIRSTVTTHLIRCNSPIPPGQMLNTNWRADPQNSVHVVILTKTHFTANFQNSFSPKMFLLIWRRPSTDWVSFGNLLFSSLRKCPGLPD